MLGAAIIVVVATLTTTVDGVNVDSSSQSHLRRLGHGRRRTGRGHVGGGWVAPVEPPLGVVGDVVSSFMYGNGGSDGAAVVRLPSQAVGQLESADVVEYRTVARANATGVGGDDDGIVVHTQPTVVSQFGEVVHTRPTVLTRAVPEDCGSPSSPCEDQEEESKDETDRSSTDDWDKKFERSTTSAPSDADSPTNNANHHAVVDVDAMAATLTATLAELAATLDLLGNMSTSDAAVDDDNEDDHDDDDDDEPDQQDDDEESPRNSTVTVSAKTVGRGRNATSVVVSSSFLQSSATTHREPNLDRLKQLINRVEDRARTVHRRVAERKATVQAARQRAQRVAMVERVQERLQSPPPLRPPTEEDAGDSTVDGDGQKSSSDSTAAGQGPQDCAADTSTPQAYAKLEALVKEVEKVRWVGKG